MTPLGISSLYKFQQTSTFKWSNSQFQAIFAANIWLNFCSFCRVDYIRNRFLCNIQKSSAHRDEFMTIRLALWHCWYYHTQNSLATRTSLFIYLKFWTARGQWSLKYFYLDHWMQLCLPLHILYFTTNVSSDTLIASDPGIAESFCTYLYQNIWRNITRREDPRTLFPMRMKHMFMSSHICCYRGYSL